MAITLLLIGTVLLYFQLASKINFFNFKIYNDSFLDFFEKIKVWLLILMFLIAGVVKGLQDLDLI